MRFQRFKTLVIVDDSFSRMQAVVLFPAKQAAVQLVPQGDVQKAPLLKILVTVDTFATTCSDSLPGQAGSSAFGVPGQLAKSQQCLAHVQ